MVNSNIAGLIPDGIPENNKEGNVILNISPNPFTDKSIINISKNLPSAVFTLYNTNGKQVRQMKPVPGLDITLRREDLPSGLYFLQLVWENKVIASVKLVICD
jgi:hypothetical protein